MQEEFTITKAEGGRRGGGGGEGGGEGDHTKGKMEVWEN